MQRGTRKLSTVMRDPDGTVGIMVVTITLINTFTQEQQGNMYRYWHLGMKLERVILMLPAVTVAVHP